jgi:hypothetical protein
VKLNDWEFVRLVDEISRSKSMLDLTVQVCQTSKAQFEAIAKYLTHNKGMVEKLLLTLNTLHFDHMLMQLSATK